MKEADAIEAQIKLKVLITWIVSLFSHSFAFLCDIKMIKICPTNYTKSTVIVKILLKIVWEHTTFSLLYNDSYLADMQVMCICSELKSNGFHMQQQPTTASTAAPTPSPVAQSPAPTPTMPYNAHYPMYPPGAPVYPGYAQYAAYPPAPDHQQ